MPDIKLTQLQKDVLSFFGANTFARNFYWTGGTLLSYFYLHHRDSVDLDFFSEDLFLDDEYLQFVNDLKNATKAGKIKFNLDKNRRLYFIQRGKETVKLELVYFPFRSIEKKAQLKEFSLSVDSLTDIMVNKILSTYQRNEPKDVYDLYCYLSTKPKYDLSKLAALVEKKFGVEIEIAMLLAKINELANSLDSLQPLLLKPQKNVPKKSKISSKKSSTLLPKNI